MNRNYADLNIRSTEPLEPLPDRFDPVFGDPSADWFFAIAIYWDDAENKGAVSVVGFFLA